MTLGTTSCSCYVILMWSMCLHIKQIKMMCTAIAVNRNRHQYYIPFADEIFLTISLIHSPLDDRVKLWTNNNRIAHLNNPQYLQQYVFFCDLLVNANTPVAISNLAFIFALMWYLAFALRLRGRFIIWISSYWIYDCLFHVYVLYCDQIIAESSWC